MRLSLPLFFGFFSLCIATSCGDDAAEWTVTVISDRTTLTGSGGSPVTLQVSVLDQDRNAAPQGDSVVILCTAATADVTVLVNGSESGATSVLLDEFGSGSAEVTCNNPGSSVADVVCVARYSEGDARANYVLRCQGATAP